MSCPVCFESLTFPWALNCGHTACKPCLKHWFAENSGRKICPVCRTVAHKAEMRKLFMAYRENTTENEESSGSDFDDSDDENGQGPTGGSRPMSTIRSNHNISQQATQDSINVPSVGRQRPITPDSRNPNASVTQEVEERQVSEGCVLCTVILAGLSLFSLTLVFSVPAFVLALQNFCGSNRKSLMVIVTTVLSVCSFVSILIWVLPAVGNEQMKKLPAAAMECRSGEVEYILSLPFTDWTKDDSLLPLVCDACPQKPRCELEAQKIHQILAERDHRGSFDSQPYQFAIVTAARNGYGLSVIYLLTLGVSIESKNGNGTTALIAASSAANNTAVIRLLISRGANLEAKDSSGKTALMTAAQYRQNDALKVLLESRAATSTSDNLNRTALMWAATVNNDDGIVLLIQSRAQANAVDFQGKTALMYAASNFHLQAFHALLNYGANISARDFNRRTALDAAVMSLSPAASPAFISYMINKGASVNDVDANLQTPLILGVAKCQPDVVYYEAGDCSASVIQPTWMVLIDNGANINAKDIWGKTALMWAAQSGHVANVKRLLARSARRDLRDTYGMSAYDWAVKSNHLDIAEILNPKLNIACPNNRPNFSIWFFIFFAIIIRGIIV